MLAVRDEGASNGSSGEGLKTADFSMCSHQSKEQGCPQASVIGALMPFMKALSL